MMFFLVNKNITQNITTAKSICSNFSQLLVRGLACSMQDPSPTTMFKCILFVGCIRAKGLAVVIAYIYLGIIVHDGVIDIVG